MLRAELRIGVDVGFILARPPPLYILYGGSLVKYTGRCQNGLKRPGPAPDRGLLRGLHDPVEPLRLREVADLPTRASTAVLSEEGARLAQKLQVGPCIPVGT